MATIAGNLGLSKVDAFFGGAAEAAIGDGRDDDSAPEALAILRGAVRHLAEGRPAEALQVASEAIHLAPHLPEPCYALGQAWSALGEYARAERAFAEAIRLRGDWADAWVNYGLARYHQDAINDAKRAMGQALRYAPGHAAATTNLGAFLRLTGGGETAETLQRAVLSREPGNIAARLNLAADLLQEERGAEALALLDGIPPPEDLVARRHYHLACALAHIQHGRSDAARRALDACAAVGAMPPALAPLWHWRRVLIADAEGRHLRAKREAGAMEAALAAVGPQALPEHRIMAHFDLAKFWSSRNEHPRAFGHWVEGHRRLGESQPFSRDAHRTMIDAEIATFTAARFATGARARNRDPAPVFIVGMPRSGTTLCEQIIAAHPQAHGSGERDALGRASYALAGGEDADAVERLAGLDDAALDHAAEAFLAGLHALAPDKTRIVDKMPGNYLHLGLVGLMLPGAKIIHCVRDPRDIGLSIFTFRFHGLHPYAHDLRDLGFAIAEQARLMAHFKTVLPNQILTVALADWVEDFDGTLARVLAHLDLPPDEACHRFHEADRRVRTVSRTQVCQPVNARGLGRWKTYEQELAPLIDELERADLLTDGREPSPPSADRARLNTNASFAKDKP